jgi:ABC-2 type transport system permease protein
MKRLFKVWLIQSKNAAQTQLLTSKGGMIFLIGKVFRFLLYFVFLFSVLSGAGGLAGYTAPQAIMFFLVFNIIDVVVQFLFRGVYVFRPLVVSGNFDLDLLKPLPSFFRPLFGWTDILDLITLLPLSGFTIWYIFAHQLAGAGGILLFSLLILNSVLVGFSFHLIVCGVGVLTTEIDHLVWIYRDLTAMARFPTDIYSKGVKAALTFVVPVIVLITVPAKALMGLLSAGWILASFLFSLVLVLLSLKFWRWSLKRYTSASS